MEAYDMAGHLIRRLHQISTQVFMARARDAGFDLTPVQFAAMDAIRVNPDIDQAGVAALIAYDRATIGGVIDRLVTKGYVARSVSARDRRAREVRLTDEGEALFTALLPVVRDLQGDILARLSEDERATFMALARKSITEV
ncbi:MarR family winged helix-turn-helix transcriptional regulator [Pararhodobacter zhoushanensis]|jgi:DNA-binding MarR family transcriptional regulator|uniref:MarR family transcriptional regulator n=1 Tax=Pararhodobacter zhoushanensis TaxID=2479545 RepID=A0ABT3GWW7_9RHOB|nr:MarR family transcriptional regulator [Pararhodobacter zhoushanensis]MCW1932008.1 MarR family transcriptional regulator [Pararhodobacter zhoushanensis]